MSELHKAERLQNIANENNWETHLTTLFDVDKPFVLKECEWVLYCKRGHEALKSSWIGHAFKDSVYAYGETKTYPARPGAVQDILTGRPDASKLKISATPEELIASRHLPWSDDDAPAIDIIMSVLDKKVTWIRKIDGMTDSGVIHSDLNWGKPHFKIFYSGKNNERQLQWVDRYGFHTVALNRITDVS